MLLYLFIYCFMYIFFHFPIHVRGLRDNICNLFDNFISTIFSHMHSPIFLNIYLDVRHVAYKKYDGIKKHI